MIYVLICIILLCAMLGTWQNAQLRIAREKFFVEDDDPKYRSKWACKKIQHWNEEMSNYKDGYVIARKGKDGVPQCVRQENKPVEHTQKCNVFDDERSCQLYMNDAIILLPSSCKTADMIHENQTCRQLREKVWQCHKVDKDTYYAVRKNEDRDIECLGYNHEQCIAFPSALDCMEAAPTIKNEKNLTCGEMMYQLYNHNGYKTEGHWCNKLKDKSNII